jgi:hypothetical protein
MKSDFICRIVGPGQFSETNATVTLRGRIGLQRLRPDLTIVLARGGARIESGGGDDWYRREPLEPSAACKDESGLLAAFCTRPLPQIREVSLQNNLFQLEWLPEPFGSTSEMTCVTANVNRGIPPLRHDDPVGTRWIFDTTVSYPTETFIQDVLFPNDVPEQLSATVATYAITGVEPSRPRQEADRLAVAESVTLVGSGRAALRVPEIPRYSDMVNHCLRRMGWKPEMFCVYRCRVRFPVVPSAVRICLSLPPMPGAG